MAAARVLILGCGYTGRRVAKRLVARGVDVIATTRNAASLSGLPIQIVEADTRIPATLERLAPFNSGDFSVLHSVPSIDSTDPTPALMAAVSHAARVVYISTTGVYGVQGQVDVATAPDPVTPREWLRMDAERSVAQAKSYLVLRPAAIYGPFRGIHSSMREGKYQLAGEGANFVSRIHVDDLASHCVAGLFSTLTGAWPVADEEPCRAREIAAFCSDLLGLPMPRSANAAALGETRRADRRVDGSAIRKALGIELRYPSYCVGIPACVAAEASPLDL